MTSDFSIEPMVALVADSRIERSIRAKRQRRDKYGRWVEMGGGVTIDVMVGGQNRKIKGKFVGGDPGDDSRGLFLVDNEEGIAPKVYSFKMKAVKRSLASLDSDYLTSQGIDDPNKDVNGNYIGKTLSRDIEGIEYVYSVEATDDDRDIAEGRGKELDQSDIEVQAKLRSEAPTYESYNVVATLDEADTPDVLSKEQLQTALEEVGVESDKPKSAHKEEAVKIVLDYIADRMANQRGSLASLKELFTRETLSDPNSEDEDIRHVRDMAYYVSDLVERSGAESPRKSSYYTSLASTLAEELISKAQGKKLDIKKLKVSGRADTVKKITQRKGGATLDPLTLSQPRTGIAVAVDGRSLEVSDAVFFGPIGDLIVADYIDKNRDKFSAGFKLGTWHDVDNDEVTLDVVELFPEGRQQEAEEAGKNRNQQGIFKLSNKEYISTGGTGERGRARKERELQRGEVRLRTETGRDVGQPDSGREGSEGKSDSSVNDEGPVVFKNPDAINSAPISQRAALELNTKAIDSTKLGLRQRLILNMMLKSRERLLNGMERKALDRDAKGFQRAYALAAASTDVINRFVGRAKKGDLASYGKGENERLKNMLFFNDSLRIREETGRVDSLQGVYTTKQGDQYYLKYDSSSNKAGVYAIDADGVPKPDSAIAYVSINWAGEDNRGGNLGENASISYLHSSDEGKGLGAVAVTFARLVVEKSGREFAHSYNLTNQGAHNSKAIEPTDPARHHYSQSEKVLWMMGAPSIDLFRKLGFFKRDNPLQKTELGGFEREINPAGPYGREYMYGPAYLFDRDALPVARELTKNMLPSYMPEFFRDAKNEDESLKNLRVQFMLEDLNWKDGISKEDAIARLRELSKAFNDLADAREREAAEDSRRPITYWERGMPEQARKFSGIYKDLADTLEADKNFDSKRLDRPKKLDQDLPKYIDVYGKGEQENFFDQGNTLVLDGIDVVRYQLVNYADSERRAMTKWEHSSYFGIEAPPAWNPDPSYLAKAFTSEELFNALREALVNASKDPTKYYGVGLKFKRDFAEDEGELGYVPMARAIAALEKQGATYNGMSLKEFIAESVDIGNEGRTKNLEKLDQSTKSSAGLMEEIDKYFQKNPPKQDAPATTTTGEPANVAVPTYDEGAGMAISVTGGEGLAGDRTIDLIENTPLLSVNKKYSLPNDLGEVLSEGAFLSTPELRSDAYSSSTSYEPPKIARAFAKEDLIKAFSEAIKRGNTEVPLKWAPSWRGPEAKINQTPINAVRDALQLHGVDTNGLMRQLSDELKEDVAVSESDILELGRQGLAKPVPAKDILEEINTPIDIDKLSLIGASNNGVNGVEFMQDPSTGKKYVVKRFQDALNAENEMLTQAFYKLAGINASVPRRGISSDPGHYIVSDWVEADLNNYEDVYNGNLSKDAENRVKDAVLNGFPMDMLLDQIDGVFNTGNVLIDDEGRVYRIDGGGGLLMDPVQANGIKHRRGTDRVMAMVGGSGMTRERRAELRDMAAVTGSFMADAQFTIDFYTNKEGLHWAEMARGIRSELLTRDEENPTIARRTDEILNLVTPDKISELVSVISEPTYAEIVRENLLRRRAEILKHFGIEDRYDPEASRLQSEATPANIEMLDRYSAFVEAKESASPELDTPSIEEVQSAIEEARIRPPVSFDNNDESIIDEPVDMTGLVVETDLSPRDIQQSEITFTPVSENGENLRVSDLQAGDRVTYLDRGTTEPKSYTVLAVVNNPDTGKNVVIGRDDTKKISIYEHADDTAIAALRPSRVENQSEISPDAAEARGRIVNRLQERSNKVLSDIKRLHPNAKVLANGDLVVSSRNFITAAGKRYRYEVVVHRKPNEEFVTYVRETDLDTEITRVNKISNQTHSSLALNNKIAPLINGNTRGKGIYGSNPRNWFNQGNKIESEVVDPNTGMLLPRSIAPAQNNIPQILNTGIPSTGNPVKDAVIEQIAGLVARGIPAFDVLNRFRNNGLLSNSNVLDIIERVEANRAFPGVNQIPFVSRDKNNIVRVGDRVRHFAADGSVKEGVVRLRRPLSVSQKLQGDYGYTDVVVVKFDGRAQGTPIVTSNLEIITRADGNAPDVINRVDNAQEPSESLAPTAESAPDAEFKMPESESLSNAWNLQIEGDSVTYTPKNSELKTSAKISKRTNSSGDQEFLLEFSGDRALGEGDLSMVFTDARGAQFTAELFLERSSRRFEAAKLEAGNGSTEAVEIDKPESSAPEVVEDAPEADKPAPRPEPEAEGFLPRVLPQTRKVVRLEVGDKVKFPDGSVRTVKSKSENEDGTITIEYEDGESATYGANDSVSITESRRVPFSELRRRLEAKRAEREKLDEKPEEPEALSADQLADGYGFSKSGENSWIQEESGENGESYAVSQGSNGKWYVTELSGNGPDNFRDKDLAEFDNPKDAFDYANNQAATPRNFTPEDTSAEPEAPAPVESQTSDYFEAINIKVGDVVKAPNGEFKKVTERFLTDSGPRITFEDGTVNVYSDEDKVELQPEDDIEIPELVDEPLEKPEQELTESEKLAATLGERMRKRALEAEPQTTELVKSIAKGIGGVLKGLRNRVKTTSSIVNKILRDAQEFDGDLEKAAENINDYVRYTTVIDDDNYVSGLKTLIKTLEAQGYKLRVKNFWSNTNDNTYRGVNIKMMKDDFEFELQVHTPNSYEVKEDALHKIYKEIAELKDNPEQNTDRLNELKQRMGEIAAGIALPADYEELLKIGDIKIQRL